MTASPASLAEHRARRLPALLRAMRPHQWVKNLFVLAPVAFAGPVLRDQGDLRTALVLRVALGCLAFCLASSATYLLNDLHDVEADRQHPVKRRRPIASGELGVAAAWRAFFVLLALAVGMGLWSGGWFVGYLVAYFVMNLAYSKGLKRVAYVDAVVISFGFLLRILAGAEAASVVLSHWLVACTVLLSLYLALGKRKHELLTSDASHRSALRKYRESHLNVVLGVLALATSAAYLSYTLDPGTAARFHTHLLPWTTPFPVIGLWRFSVLLEAQDTAHSPTERMLRDPIFLANLGAWAVAVFLIIYGVVGGDA